MSEQTGSSGDLLAAHLIGAGIVAPHYLAYASRVRQLTKRGLADVLLELRLLGDEELAEAFGTVLGLPVHVPRASDFDADALAEVPYAFARQARVLPLRIEGDALVVATADPLSGDADGRLGRLSSRQLRWVVAPRAQLVRCIESFYHSSQRPIDAEIAQFARAGSITPGFDAERLVDLLIGAGIQAGASDVHLVPSPMASLVFLRVDGVLQQRYVLPSDAHVRLASVIKVASGMDIAESRRPQDGRMTFTLMQEAFDLRVSVVPTTRGESVVLRILSAEGDVIPLRRLGFTPGQQDAIRRMFAQPAGIVLAAGPTGSGKTTTLYAALRTQSLLERNVMTIEDPVEYAMPLVRQVSVNERTGVSFASAVRAFLRQDPDVMMVGEIRDHESAVMAVRAAQTGHLVPASLHTNSAVGAVIRMRDLGIEPYLLSASIVGVVAQRLVRRLCGACGGAAAGAGGSHGAADGPRAATRGCARCGYTGYSGRVVVGEVLVFDDGMRELVQAGAGAHEMHRYALAHGMEDMHASGRRLVRDGVTDEAELARVLGDL